MPSVCLALASSAVWFGEQIPLSAREGIHPWLDQGPVDLMLVVGTTAMVWPATLYIHSTRLAGARIGFFNPDEPDLDVDDELQKLSEQDWFFERDAGAVIADVLQEVVGSVPEMNCNVEAEFDQLRSILMKVTSPTSCHCHVKHEAKGKFPVVAMSRSGVPVGLHYLPASSRAEPPSVPYLPRIKRLLRYVLQVFASSVTILAASMESWSCRTSQQAQELPRQMSDVASERRQALLSGLAVDDGRG
ncbi:MAG: hypothetical protein Q9197_000321 [Variospora fuerteventurae]